MWGNRNLKKILSDAGELIKKASKYVSPCASKCLTTG
jgi:hypothetical protein